ncbi:hypothetical protein tb265_47840 [Gemmatimonadetes bacterium T265]|nr:hypothetical protein tb265_47840 [Gemmatimonadetes bacterium T265]
MMRTPVLRATALAAAAALGAALAACDNTSHEQEIRGAGRGTNAIPDEGTLARVPLGDWAGATPNTLANTIRNPYEGDSAAAREGGALYQQMNCADCHGYDLKGGMGPNLRDRYWRYGGSPAEIYKTLWEGRPQGMPAWGRALPPEQLWKLVTYIESFHGTFPAPLADRGKQGDLGDEDTTGARTLRGAQNADQ